MSGRGFVDYSENGDHTDRQIHRGGYRVRPGLKMIRIKIDLHCILLYFVVFYNHLLQQTYHVNKIQLKKTLIT